MAAGNMHDNRLQVMSMSQCETDCPELRLQVTPGSSAFFTSVLQYGSRLQARCNMSLGEFLVCCPGFSKDYIKDTVQTIFLDGTAMDDLATPLTASHHVVALSAAMPGLAGAIFRRNGPHATLRTSTGSAPICKDDASPINVTLKLFNAIAKDKGELMLSNGICLESRSAAAFFSRRTELLDRIIEASLDVCDIFPEELPDRLREVAGRCSLIRLCINERKS